MDIASKHKRQKTREQANEIRIQDQRRKKMTTLEGSTEVGISNARNINAAQQQLQGHVIDRHMKIEFQFKV